VARRIHRRGAAALLVTLLALLLGPALPLASAGAAPSRSPWLGCQLPDCQVGVGGSPHHASFLGSGGLLLDSSFSGLGVGRDAIATCTDCEWLLTTICKGGPGGGCHGIDSCPPDHRRMLVFLRHAGDPDYNQVGSYCMGRDGPVTVGEMAQRLRDVVVERVPPVRWSYQPAGGAVVNLPAVFSSGQPQRLDTRTFDLIGFRVVLNAQPRWNWSWGDGASTTTDQAGGAWPDLSVTHTYRRSGPVQIALTTSWSGWFTVDDIGPFPTGGTPVVQQAGPWVLPVREARARLVTP
jgi:hypothetical protein